MVMGGGVEYELDVMGPAMGGVWHLNLLSMIVVVGNRSIKHSEPWRHCQVMSNHANIHLSLTWFCVSI